MYHEDELKKMKQSLRSIVGHQAGEQISVNQNEVSKDQTEIRDQTSDRQDKRDQTEDKSSKSFLAKLVSLHDMSITSLTIISYKQNFILQIKMYLQ